MSNETKEALKFVMTEDLIDELINRSNGCVVSLMRTEEGNMCNPKTRWGGGHLHDLISLASTVLFQLNTEYDKHWRIGEIGNKDDRKPGG